MMKPNTVAPVSLSMRQSVSLLKGLAVLSVICAHCNAIPSKHNIFAEMCSCFLSNLGTIGVICFFVISGFLFHCESKRSFFIKKGVAIGVPWLVGALAVYLYVTLRKSSVSFVSFLNFLVGNGSYFYYLTILLLLLYITFSFVPWLKNTVPLIALGVVGIISGVFFSSGVPIAPTPYLNYFNWVGYFAFGILIRSRLSLFSLVFQKIYRFRWGIYIAELLILLYQILHLQGGWYFGFPYMLFSWCGALAFFFLAQDIKRVRFTFPKRVLQDAGENSLFVYIWHMPIGGIVANVFSLGPLVWLVLIRPLVVFAIVLLTYYLMRRLLVKLKCEKIGLAIGIKQ